MAQNMNQMKIRQNTNRIILHYTATPKGQDVTVEDVRRWHVGRGWSDIGYHFLVDLDGYIHPARPVHMQGAHTKGQNWNSIGIVYVGGLDEDGNDTMTTEQARSIRHLIEALRTIYGPLTLHGHKEFKNTMCPGFEVNERFRDVL
jgi:N-acetylmuramoyl-L-alanine amidase